MVAYPRRHCVLVNIRTRHGFSRQIDEHNQVLLLNKSAAAGFLDERTMAAQTREVFLYPMPLHAASIPLRRDMRLHSQTLQKA